MANESLARKIAELMDAERPDVDLSSIHASLSSIDVRLEKLEASRLQQPLVVALTHPSLDKLSIAEAIADHVFAGAGSEKACTFEPNAKPCDHCSMCNSRGF